MWHFPKPRLAASASIMPLDPANLNLCVELWHLFARFLRAFDAISGTDQIELFQQSFDTTVHAMDAEDPGLLDAFLSQFEQEFQLADTAPIPVSFLNGPVKIAEAVIASQLHIVEIFDEKFSNRGLPKDLKSFAILVEKVLGPLKAPSLALVNFLLADAYAGFKQKKFAPMKKWAAQLYAQGGLPATIQASELIELALKSESEQSGEQKLEHTDLNAMGQEQSFGGVREADGEGGRGEGGRGEGGRGEGGRGEGGRGEAQSALSDVAHGLHLPSSAFPAEYWPGAVPSEIKELFTPPVIPPKKLQKAAVAAIEEALKNEVKEME